MALALGAAIAAAPSVALPPEDEVWRALDTPSFALLGNATADELSLVAQRLESLKAVLDRLGDASGRAATRRIPVIVFRSASSFDPYRQAFGKGAKSVAGYYTEGLNARFIAMNVAAGDTPYPVVYHEYLHAVVREKFGRVPVWFNEGLAGVYETFTSSGGRAEVGKPSRARLLYMTDHPWMTVSALIAVSEDTSLHDRDDASTEGFYAHSWLLVHDILFGHPERQKQLAAFLAAYVQGTPQAEAFEKHFVGGVAGVDAELRAYVRTRLPHVTVTFDELPVPAAGEAREVPRADVLVTLGRLLLVISDDVSEATAHFEAARALRPEDRAARAGLGLAAYRKGPRDEAAALLDGVIEAGTEDPSVLYVAGRLTLERAQDDRDAAAATRARDLAARAMAVTPDDPDTLALFGASFVGQPADPAQGIAALERADGLEPRRVDVLTSLVALQAQTGDRKAAEAAAARVEKLNDPRATTHARDSLAMLDVAESNRAARAKDYGTAIALLKSAREKASREDQRARLDERIGELEKALAASKKKPAPKR